MIAESKIGLEPDNVSGFGFEVRTIAGHVTFQAVRLQGSLSPYAMDSLLAEAFLLTPKAEASLRQLQWVEPFLSFFRVAANSSVRALD
jgi:hypothetical protein